MKIFFFENYFINSIQSRQFEENNDLSINVYVTEKDWTFIRPLRFSKRSQVDPINLLMIYDPEEDESHFAYIRNLDRLLNRRGAKQYTYCPRCLYGYCVQRNGHANLKKHIDEGQCTEKDAVQVTYPPPNKQVMFEKYKALIDAPLVLYADFESSMKKMKHEGKGRTQFKTEHIITG